MKSIEISRTSKLYRFARNFGDLGYWEEEINLCTFRLNILKGILRIFVMSVSALVFLVTLLVGIYSFVSEVYENSSMHDLSGFAVYGLAWLIVLGSTALLALFSKCQDVYQAWLRKRNHAIWVNCSAKNEPVPVNVIKAVYLSWKEKHCSKVTIVD
jgi:hypothetical protein